MTDGYVIYLKTTQCYVGWAWGRNRWGQFERLAAATKFPSRAGAEKVLASLKRYAGFEAVYRTHVGGEMLAYSLHIEPTAEHHAPWQPTPSEAIEAVQVLERYARGGACERLSAAEDMHRIIARVAMRACEEMGRQ